LARRGVLPGRGPAILWQPWHLFTLSSVVGPLMGGVSAEIILFFAKFSKVNTGTYRPCLMAMVRVSRLLLCLVADLISGVSS
jgi:hypothetical protein